tara:strand:+ start:3730 stop:4122 length:393 start_codon:yes stop_codon:yes gene_type:complete
MAKANPDLIKINTISPPRWCSHAIPTRRGWEDPDTGELLKSMRHTQAELDKWHGVEPVEEKIKPHKLMETPPPPPPPVEPEEVEEEEDDIESMSKLELELLGREHGVELDRRQSKSSLVSQIKGLLNKNS